MILRTRHSVLGPRELERNAIEAERASIKYKQAEFMQQHLGKVFRGIVSGVTDWGFFVTLQPSYCEGLVRLATLDHDYYVFDAERLTLVGRRSGRQVRLGDELNVKVIDANPNQRQIDLGWEADGLRSSSQRSHSSKSRDSRSYKPRDSRFSKSRDSRFSKSRDNRSSEPRDNRSYKPRDNRSSEPAR